MSHRKGADLGGIRSIETLKLRCIVDELSGCWEWTGAVVDGAPRVHCVHPVTLERTSGKGRRIALLLARGKDVPKGHVAWQKPGCSSLICVNPAHCKSGPKAEWGRWLTESGRVKNLPSKCVASRKGWDKRGRKITPEMKQQIMTMPGGTVEVGRALGVSHFAVWAVRQKLSHLEGMRNSSVWTYRP